MRAIQGEVVIASPVETKQSHMLHEESHPPATNFITGYKTAMSGDADSGPVTRQIDNSQIFHKYLQYFSQRIDMIHI
jgi:hypothetical protein